MQEISRRRWILSAAGAAGLMDLTHSAVAQAYQKRDVSAAITKGAAFLVSLMDAELDLLPEYPGSNVYWLFHDNYLAAKVLKSNHPEIAKRIDQAMHSHGVMRSGKIEILFNEAEKPLPFRRFKLVDVKPIGNKILRTEIAESEPLENWQVYADLLLLSAIALAETDPAKAKQDFDAAARMWDGHGFNDLAAKSSGQYATYKLAFFLVAAKKLNSTPSIQEAVLEKLLAQQAEVGGWITDYDAKGRRIGLVNVETTSLAIVALDKLAEALPTSVSR
jgi:hypothetical protein